MQDYEELPGRILSALMVMQFPAPRTHQTMARPTTSMNVTSPTISADSSPQVVVRDLVRIFETDHQRVVAVDHLSIQVSAGEVYGLLGPNGAGKTTTLRIMLGLQSPDAGRVRIAGIDVTEQPLEVKRRVSLVSASSGLYQWLTPRELMWYFADLYDIPDEVAAHRIDFLADLFEIRSFLDRRCAGMSTGQQQRVNLARSLMHDPPVVLLDEPTRGLDIVGSSRIFEFTGLLRDQGKAVVFCTHRLDEAERLCTRFGVMNHGRLHLEGTLEELRSKTGLRHLAEMFLQLVNTPSDSPQHGSVAPDRRALP